MSTAAIAKVLIEKGVQVFRRPREPVPFTQNREADAMLNDLDRFPHGFVLGCVMDRGAHRIAAPQSACDARAVLATGAEFAAAFVPAAVLWQRRSVEHGLLDLRILA